MRARRQGQLTNEDLLTLISYFFPILNCFLIVHKIREISAGKGDFEGGQEKSVEVKDFFNGLEKYVFSQLTQGNFRNCPSFFSIYC